jgi:hypothetical protein
MRRSMRTVVVTMRTVVVLLGLAVLTASAADDFWVTKDWHTWTKEEAQKMLHDSPWAQSLVEDFAGRPRPAPPARFVRQTYYFQLRSAMPERRAFIRDQQFLTNYDQMTPDKKQAFDAQADHYLAQMFDQTIIVQVVFNAGNLLEMVNAWQALPQAYAESNFFIITQHGAHVAATRWVQPSKGTPEFEIVFPRLQNGEPIIQPADKQFTVEIRVPRIVDDPASQEDVIFDLGKMKVDGQPVF